MKIYFNSTFIERERITDDLWVKGNNGNRIEAYFDDLDLSNNNINLRLVIEWSNGETTNELPLLKGYLYDYAYITLSKLAYAGNTKFTIRIYQNDTLLQTAIFTRNIKESINAKDEFDISFDEYEQLLSSVQEMDSKITENQTNIHALDERTTSNETNISNLEGKINDLENKVPEIDLSEYLKKPIEQTPTKDGQFVIVNADGSTNYSTETLKEVTQRITNLEQNQGGGGSNEPSNNTTCAISVKQIVVDEFSALETDKSPYTHFANVTITSLTDTTKSIELINDNPVLFSKHGFAIASVNGSVVELYSIGKPEEDVTLKFEIYKAYSVWDGSYTEE